LALVQKQLWTMKAWPRAEPLWQTRVTRGQVLGIGWLLGLAIGTACPLKWLACLALGAIAIAAGVLQRDRRERWRPTLTAAFMFMGAARYVAGRDRDGTSLALLAAAAPEWVIFSVGDAAHNPHHHPAVRVLERVEAQGCAICRTDRQGSLCLITDGEQMWVEAER